MHCAYGIVSKRCNMIRLNIKSHTTPIINLMYHSVYLYISKNEDPDFSISLRGLGYFCVSQYGCLVTLAVV